VNHSEARAIVDGLTPELTPIESLFVRMVSFFETNYGTGWQEDGGGKGSNNWGAITMAPKGVNSNECPGGFRHEDSLFDSATGKVKRYTTCFRSYATPADGAMDVVRVALKPNVRAAFPSLRGAVAAMHANKYFLGIMPTATENVDAYAAALTRALRAIVKETGEPDPFVMAGAADTLPPSPGSESLGSSGTSLPVLRLGTTGLVVELWRELVTRDDPALSAVRDSRSPDVFDVPLRDATRAFQSLNRLAVDGVVGNLETWPMMVRLLRAEPIREKE